MKFDHDKFFANYKEKFGPIKAQSKADGISNLLAQLEADPDVKDVRWAAYMFATVKHECADMWHPIEEFGKGKTHDYGKPVQVTDAAGKKHTCTYYGRGYVQLTWQANYKKMGEALGLGETLLIHPEQALDPAIAYKIMSYGMRHGSFTGKKLADYINTTTCDYIHARRIINGVDRAELIQGYALHLEECFTGSLVTI